MPNCAVCLKRLYPGVNLIGSAPGADTQGVARYRVAHAALAAQHCCVVVGTSSPGSGPRVWLADLGSREGTFVATPLGHVRMAPWSASLLPEGGRAFLGTLQASYSLFVDCQGDHNDTLLPSQTAPLEAEGGDEAERGVVAVVEEDDTVFDETQSLDESDGAGGALDDTADVAMGDAAATPAAPAAPAPPREGPEAADGNADMGDARAAADAAPAGPDAAVLPDASPLPTMPHPLDSVDVGAGTQYSTQATGTEVFGTAPQPAGAQDAADTEEATRTKAECKATEEERLAAEARAEQEAEAAQKAEEGQLERERKEEEAARKAEEERAERERQEAEALARAEEERTRKEAEEAERREQERVEAEAEARRGAQEEAAAATAAAKATGDGWGGAARASLDAFALGTQEGSLPPARVSAGGSLSQPSTQVLENVLRNDCERHLGQTDQMPKPRDVRGAALAAEDVEEEDAAPMHVEGGAAAGGKMASQPPLVASQSPYKSASAAQSLLQASKGAQPMPDEPIGELAPPGANTQVAMDVLLGTLPTTLGTLPTTMSEHELEPEPEVETAGTEPEAEVEAEEVELEAETGAVSPPPKSEAAGGAHGKQGGHAKESYKATAKQTPEVTLSLQPVANLAQMTRADLKKLRVAELKSELRSRGLSIDGLKAALLARLEVAIATEASGGQAETPDAEPAAEEAETVQAAEGTTPSPAPAPAKRASCRQRAGKAAIEPSAKRPRESSAEVSDAGGASGVTPPSSKRAKAGGGELRAVLADGIEGGKSSWKKLEGYLTKLGGTRADDKDVASATVLVMDELKRTEKVFLALAAGVHIVSSEWLAASAKAGGQLPKEDYPPGNLVKFQRAQGVDLATSLAEARRGGVLAGREVFCHKSCWGGKLDWRAIVRAAGGTPLEKMPRSAGALVFVSEADRAQVAAARGQVYSQDLLVDAIMHQRLDLGSKFALDAGGVASGGRRSRR